MKTIGEGSMKTAESDELHVPKGAMIFRQGDPGDEMFVISEGKVRLTLGSGGHQKEIAVLAVGEFFGELSLLSGAARSATAEAIEDSTLLAIGRDAFAMMVQDDLDIVFHMLDTQGKRLSRANQPIQELVERLEWIRIATACLERVWSGNGKPSVPVDVDELAAELGIDRDEVMVTVSDLVKRGVGRIDNGSWTIVNPDEVTTLIEVLSVYAAGRS